jgi:hypothetical protein
MDQQNPLTDPTSLIAYRLANGHSSVQTKPANTAASKRQVWCRGIALGLAVAAIIATAMFLI